MCDPRIRFVGEQLLGLFLGCLWAVPAVGAAAPDESVTDASVDAAIGRAVTWLKAQRDPTTHWEGRTPPQDLYWGGTSALVCLSLLYAGEDPRTEFMESSLGWLAGQTLHGTYTYGTRAHALALVPGEKYRSRLQSDLEWLVQNVWPATSSDPGAYSYYGKEGDWDNSNSQYGVLGVWMAEDAGLPVTATYWRMIGEHWMRTQQGDGGWTYKATGQSTGSMTAAGLATLFVVLDRVYGERQKDAAGLLASIDRGLSWLGREYTPQNPFGDEQWLYYYLYGVERVGRASGYKYFRNKEWFREGAAFLLKSQQPDGSWPRLGEFMSDARNTAFALMFLCHGRAPLLFNKLEHGADWNSKMRDVAGLTHFAQRALERLLNWQIVRLDSPLEDLLEAPVLYLCGQTAWEFTDVDIQKIREYCLRGGMVLAVAGAGKTEFTDSITGMAQKAFPDLRPRPLPPNHPLFNGEIQFPLDKPPPIDELSNGLRTLMLISREDISETWGRAKGRREHIELGCNIFSYATDKTSQRSRLQTNAIVPRQVEIRRKLEVALIKYNGNWNVEPYGWTRLKHYLNNETGTRLLLTSGLTLDSKELKEQKIAYLTGTGRFELSPDEQRGLQNFLRNGGTLLADAAGGSDEFRKSLESYVTEALKVEPKRLSADSFLVTGHGIPDATDLSSVGYTRSARGREKTPPLRAYDVGPRLAVICSPLDITGALVGGPTYNRRGYDGEGALRVMRNLLLYADLPARDKSRLARP